MHIRCPNASLWLYCRIGFDWFYELTVLLIIWICSCGISESVADSICEMHQVQCNFPTSITCFVTCDVMCWCVLSWRDVMCWCVLCLLTWCRCVTGTEVQCTSCALCSSMLLIFFIFLVWVSVCVLSVLCTSGCSCCLSVGVSFCCYVVTCIDLILA